MNTPNTPSDTPVFPPELECLIFQSAARADRRQANKLELVAQRIREWVIPIRYEIFVDNDLPVSPPFFPAIGQHVRHLLVPYNTTTPEWPRIYFTACPNIHNLAIWAEPTMTPDFPAFINALPLRKLSTALKILANCGPTSLYHLPHLTHLELVRSEDFWSAVKGVALFPNLTHLAYGSHTSWEVLSGSLEHCQKLQVLVLMGPTNSETRSALPEEEVRLVEGFCVAAGWRRDWCTGAEGGEDFWVRAEAIVDSRRRNQIGIE